MTKEEFIAEAKKLGFKKHKDLSVMLGYGERVLDRYKYTDEINEKFVHKFEHYKKSFETGVAEQYTPDTTPHHNTQADTQAEPEIKTYVQVMPDIPDVDSAPATMGVMAESFADGIGFDISNEDYHASKFLSSSRIKMVLENARLFQAQYITKEKPNKKTDALLVGSLFHTLVLEPHKIEEDYAFVTGGTLKDEIVADIEAIGGIIERIDNKVVDTVPVLKAKFERLKSKSNRTVVTRKNLELAEVIAKRALESAYVIEANGKILLSAKLKDILKMPIAYVERTFYGTIEGECVQIRTDILLNLGKNEDVWFVIDLKSGIDATQAEFAKGSSKYMYDIQQSVYKEVLAQNNIHIVDFRFCVAGKGDYSGTAYYQLDKEDIEDADKIVKAIMKKYKYCKENDTWEEGRFNYQDNRFEPVAIIKLPTYRKFQMIDLGVL